MANKNKRFNNRRKEANLVCFLAFSRIVDANIYTIFEASTS